MSENPRQIEDADGAFHGRFYVSAETPGGDPELSIEDRQLNAELRGDDELWVEPDDVCGVHYVFRFHEFKALVDGIAAGLKVAKPERVVAAELEAKLTEAELRAERAEAKRDDAERRIAAVNEWAEKNGHKKSLAKHLGTVVKPAE